MASDQQASPEVPESHYEEAEAAFEESLGSEFGTASIIEETESEPTKEQVSAKRTRPMLTTMRQLSVRNHKVAGALAIALGIFGMHKFFLGYHEQGFALLLVTIILGVITSGVGVLFVWLFTLVEGLNYLTLPQARFESIYVDGTRNWF